MANHSCADCQKYYPPMFSILDVIWITVAPTTIVLCLECFERRLGRLVVPSDLKPSPLTEELKLGYKIFKRAE